MKGAAFRVEWGRPACREFKPVGGEGQASAADLGRIALSRHHENERRRQEASTRHPLQRIERDEYGVRRFVPNSIVVFLLDHGENDLNGLATLGFSVEDWEQFSQLTGYSVSGWMDLDYVSEEAKDLANQQEEPNRET
jgi:hypothetical protein